MATTLNLNTPDGVRDYLCSNRSFLNGTVGMSSANLTIVPVSGGLANHTYRAIAQNQEDKASLIIKYAPPTVASNVSFPLSSRRGVST